MLFPTKWIIGGVWDPISDAFGSCLGHFGVNFLDNLAALGSILGSFERSWRLFGGFVSLWGGVGGSTEALCNYFEGLGGSLWFSLETLGKCFCILQRLAKIWEHF